MRRILQALSASRCHSLGEADGNRTLSEWWARSHSRDAIVGTKVCAVARMACLPLHNANLRMPETASFCNCGLITAEPTFAMWQCALFSAGAAVALVLLSLAAVRLPSRKVLSKVA